MVQNVDVDGFGLRGFVVDPELILKDIFFLAF